MGCFFHKWDGCVCSKCGKKRDSHHTFEAEPHKCREVCRICGQVRPLDHRFKDGLCQNCGCEQTVIAYFLAGEKIDVGDPKMTAFILQNSNAGMAMPAWRHWNGGEELSLFFKAIDQLIVTNPGFAEKIKPFGVIKAGSDLYLGTSAAVASLEKEFASGLDRFLLTKKVVGEIYYLHGDERFVQSGSSNFYTYTPKWRIAVFFCTKPGARAGAAAPAAGGYTVEQGVADLSRAFLSEAPEALTKEIGQKLYDAKIPLLNGVGGMYQAYHSFKRSQPMRAAQLSKIWDGIGDWAD